MPFAEWYSATTGAVPVVRCVFEDDELHRSIVRDLLLRQGDEGVLGDRYREDSILIEPDTNHFDLERPDVVQRHLEAIVADLEVIERRGRASPA
jgi:hypothetical protein